MTLGDATEQAQATPAPLSAQATWRRARKGTSRRVSRLLRREGNAPAPSDHPPPAIHAPQARALLANATVNPRDPYGHEHDRERRSCRTGITAAYSRRSAASAIHERSQQRDPKDQGRRYASAKASRRASPTFPTRTASTPRLARRRRLSTPSSGRRSMLGPTSFPAPGLLVMTGVGRVRASRQGRLGAHDG